MTDAIKLAESDTIFIKHHSDVMTQGVYIRMSRFDALREKYKEALWCLHQIPTCCMTCVLEFKEVNEKKFRELKNWKTT